MEKETIYTALLAFQELGISIKKDGTNPHFKNKYATLDEILGKVKPPLSKLGVWIGWLGDEDGNAITLVLRHVKSETEITSTVPYIQKQDAQKLGSNITYNKRYSVVSALALEDEDDDGTKAVAPEPKITLEQAFSSLKLATTLEALAATYKSLPVELQKDTEVIALKDELKKTYV